MSGTPGKPAVVPHAIGQAAAALREVFAETIWPSRCVLCDALGPALCKPCAASLPYVDQWRACPRCGAPYGLRQCTECNGFSLKSLGVRKLPYASCVSAVHFSSEVAKIVRVRKDEGERALALPMAYAMACAIPQEWVEQGAVVTFVPSTKRALRARGFCHGQELAQQLAVLLGLPCERLLGASEAADQRQLGRAGRVANAQGRFQRSGRAFRRVILADDVYTTGATAMAAAEALASAGSACVRVATFARVLG